MGKDCKCCGGISETYNLLQRVIHLAENINVIAYIKKYVVSFVTV